MDTNISLALAFVVLVSVYLARRKTRGLQFPPGPPGRPLIGNVFDMPRSNEWVQYKEWGQKSKSDIIHLSIFGTHLIILNSLEAVSDLLDKRSAIYSDRMGWSWTMGVMPANAEWRSQRRHFRQEFDGGEIRRHYPSIISATNDLLKRFIDTPDKWGDHLRHMVGAIIMDVAYGIEVLPVGDPYILTAEASFANVTKVCVPGAYLRKAKEWKKLTDAILEAPFEAMRREMDNGSAKASFCSRNLQHAEDKGDLKSEEPHIKAAAGGMYGALLTLVVQIFAFLETFMLAMVQHPEAQQKAHAEIDAVLGSGLPTFEDQKSLPYLSALIMECSRWEPVAAFTIPRMLTVDDEYRGYLLPKGACIIPNIYQISKDEETYPEPFSFQPERYLKDGKIDHSVMNPTTMGMFGYGRRICPGRHLAEKSAWLAAVSILAMFRISKAVDEDGAIIEPSGRYTSGMTRHPEVFQCQITPRSNEARDLINATEGDATGQ
ncbi:cytochrome P450 [Athelia psychrophila]|uniref:Cytochrome P450 n=1 Tax=Athelia psychrophila TaxID=1759441 RepID=A0A166SRQ2_9AGAM|nr:cytochrome P450 [Fibularhizoctonia sp. CBS 109695]